MLVEVRVEILGKKIHFQNDRMDMNDKQNIGIDNDIQIEMSPLISSMEKRH